MRQRAGRPYRFLHTYEGLVGEEGTHANTAFGANSLIDGAAVELTSCRLIGSRIVTATRMRLRDVQMTAVDAANASAEESGWHEVQVADSRWTGARLNFSHIEKSTFERCQMRHVQMQECAVKGLSFESCDLRNAFFNGSDLQGTVFTGSNLTGADFSRAQLAGCDLRRAVIEGIRIAPEQLAGVIVTPDQALYLAALMGLDVRE